MRRLDTCTAITEGNGTGPAGQLEAFLTAAVEVARAAAMTGVPGSDSDGGRDGEGGEEGADGGAEPMEVETGTRDCFLQIPMVQYVAAKPGMFGLPSGASCPLVPLQPSRWMARHPAP